MAPKKKEPPRMLPQEKGRSFPVVRPDNNSVACSSSSDGSNGSISSNSSTYNNKNNNNNNNNDNNNNRDRETDDDDLPPPLPKRPPRNTTLSPMTEIPLTREKPSSNNLRATLRPNSIFQSTIRAITPDPSLDNQSRTQNTLDPSTASQPQSSHSNGRGRPSPQSSPRIIPGSGSSLATGSGVSAPPVRRQGVVFNDTPTGSLDSSSSSPPPKQSSFRPRTHTMDGAFRQQIAPSLDSRHRVGSFSSPGSLPANDESRVPALTQPTADLPHSPAPPLGERSTDFQVSFPGAFNRDKKKAAARRLTKKPSSRPTSPQISPPPSVDSLPLPVPTDNTNKVLLLMKSLCGKMRGDVEFQQRGSGSWRFGVCYIDEERGSLMYDSGDTEPSRASVLLELRGCRVLPLEDADRGMRCLEIAGSYPGAEVRLCPLLAEEFDWWLAALLCWQQLRPATGAKALNAHPGGRPGQLQAKPRAPSSNSKDPAIIKIGQVELWDKGLATSPRSIVKRPSTRDLRSSQTSWRWVSCILQDDGEFKLMADNDGAALSVIELSQLSRCAIQRLDRSVLDRDFCIGLFPIYASSASRLSIFRPVYLALESRVLFEVWFVILRAFAVPDAYRLDHRDGDQVFEIVDHAAEPASDTFRVGRAMTVRVTEAKIRRSNFNPSSSDLSVHDRHFRGGDQGEPAGSYLAEVMLDGEVRARTATRYDTRNPFWRDECEFVDLPSPLPSLSVALKRVENSADSHKPGAPGEVLCGTVDIPLLQADRGKENEQWLPVYDDRQQSIGSLLVRVNYEELVVLLADEYRPISELLHKFSAGLTVQIALSRPRKLRRIAEILLNIFQVSGSVTEWLMNLAEDEIDGVSNSASLNKPRFSRRLKSSESLDSSNDREQTLRDMGKSLAGEANLLFRGNSLLTQALEFHMRRLGKEYLVDTLSDKIVEMNKSNPDCEVDPSKLQHGEDVRQHWNRLLRFTNEIWDCIASSADRVPPELRHILKYVRAVADDRYGDFLRTVTYTSVSGFFFLRFLCPAILNPKLFGLLHEHPRPGAQRTLTLIAKGLQALANLTTIGKKEAWMEPMNRFLNSRRQSLKDFLDEICAIPIERASLALPASYTTPITILGRLSPIAREGFPSLPYLIDGSRNFAALVKFWVDDNPIADSNSHEFEHVLLEFNSLCLNIQRRADAYQARIERARQTDTASQSQPTEADQLSLTDVIEHASLVDTLAASSYGSGSAAAWMEYRGVDSLRPPGSSGSDIDGSGFLGASAISSISSREPRPGRDPTSPKYASGSSDLAGASATGGTIKSLRDGKQARKLLGGLIRKSRSTTSPEMITTLSPPRARERELYQQSRERDGERERNRELVGRIVEPTERSRDKVPDRGPFQDHGL